MDVSDSKMPSLLFVLLTTPLPFSSSISPEKHEVAQGECLASAVALPVITPSPPTSTPPSILWPSARPSGSGNKIKVALKAKFTILFHHLPRIE